MALQEAGEEIEILQEANNKLQTEVDQLEASQESKVFDNGIWYCHQAL